METITLEHVHEDILGLRKDIELIKNIIQEDFELVDDVLNDIEESRQRSKNQFISHEKMKKEFG